MQVYQQHYPSIRACYELNPAYEHILQRTIDQALNQFTRVCALRFDLRFPDGCLYQDPEVISRFIDSFKAHLKAWDRQRLSKHSVGFSYIWCREKTDAAQNWHYHLVFIFNKDAVCGFGQNQPGVLNTYNRILNAWASALGIAADQAIGLIHICKNGVYWLDQRHRDYALQYTAAMNRFSYLAKKQTKDINDGNRNIGCSQRLFL